MALDLRFRVSSLLVVSLGETGHPWSRSSRGRPVSDFHDDEVIADPVRERDRSGRKPEEP